MGGSWGVLAARRSSSEWKAFQRKHNLHIVSCVSVWDTVGDKKRHEHWVLLRLIVSL